MTYSYNFDTQFLLTKILIKRKIDPKYRKQLDFDRYAIMFLSVTTNAPLLIMRLNES